MSDSRLRRLPIATRMLVAALILVLLILPAAGALLSWNFREAAYSAFDERLGSLLNVVLAGVTYDIREDALVSNRQLGDSRFDRVFSGWYWQVTDDGARVLTSRSLWDQRLVPSHQSGLHARTVSGPRGEKLRLLERDVRRPNLDETLHVMVAADLDEVEVQIGRFQALLWSSLATLGGLLLLLIFLQIRWGLAPLRRIEKSLKSVEQGQRQFVETDLPQELSRLAAAINTVLERDQRLIERGRTAAGNLAHALKTPVSVLAGQAERLPEEQQAAMKAELRRLDDAVRHHLARASAAGPVALGAEQPVAEVLKPVVEGIARLAERRGLTFTHRVPGQVRCRIEAQDLQEMVGNLLENAVNWARTEIALDVGAESDGLVLQVGDDGPGMPEAERGTALTRGGRLDESVPGSGLGLAIVTDLVSLYGGQVTLGDSPSGGLEARVRLPLR